MRTQIVFVAFALLSATEASGKRDLRCSVCRALVDEVNWKINRIDPKKKVQVGSFRVDPSGNQNTYEVPYGRSELHLTEVFENVCEEMANYAETTNELGKRSVIRTSSRNGKELSLTNLSINREHEKTIRYLCDTLIEEHEEVMISLFRRTYIPKMEAKICGEIAGQCSEEDFMVSLPTAPEKVDVEKENDEEDKDAQTAEAVKTQEENKGTDQERKDEKITEDEKEEL